MSEGWAVFFGSLGFVVLIAVYVFALIGARAQRNAKIDAGIPLAWNEVPISYIWKHPREYMPIFAVGFCTFLLPILVALIVFDFLFGY